jgi:large subunit ribosomal protein L18Ae
VTKEDPNPKVFSMRVFAPNTVVAKTRFWWNMKRLNKLKRANGQILAVNEVPQCIHFV